MRDALVFNGASNLDFQEIRSNIIRIPEVFARIREAQFIWDDLVTGPVDLANFIASDNSTYLAQFNLKSFTAAVVQVGLLDRYLKNHPPPQFILGTLNGDSPLKVALGVNTFVDLLTESAAAGLRPPVLKVVLDDLPVLSGSSLNEYAMFRRGRDDAYYRLASDERETERPVVDRMLIELIDHFEVGRLILLGPGNSVFGKRVVDLSARDVQVLESIDLDPMLAWFWAHLKDNRLAIAN